MALPGFVEHYDDLSLGNTYQFRFYCDKCTRSWESSPPALGLREKLLKAADKVIGGAIAEGKAALREAREAIGDRKEHEKALQDAIEQAKSYFKRCPQCGQWVCPEYCWSAAEGRCDSCAPNREEQEIVERVRDIERAKQEKQAAEDRMYEKQNVERYLKGAAVLAKAAITCPKCGAAGKSGKFCSSCGSTLQPTCSNCGAANEPSALFCSECGGKL